MNKLTAKQFEVLLGVSRGKISCHGNSASISKTLSNLAQLGLVKLHVPIGWAITASGIALLEELKEDFNEKSDN